MKITVREKSFARVAAIPRQKHRRPAKQSAFWRRLLKSLSAGEMKETGFTCTGDGLARVPGDTPCLILMNHSSFTDLQIAATLLADRQYHIVCTNDGFVGKAWLLRRLGCIPAKKFISDPVLIRDMHYCLKTLKSAVLMFPEASYSFDGTETPLPESLGKCIRMLKVPVLMIRTTGAFLRDPLYNNLQKRAVPVHAAVSVLFTAEEAAALRPAELNRRLAEAFHYDHFREQEAAGVTVSEPFRADGLHRVLYKCPLCGAEGKNEGKGDRLTCRACGAVHLLEPNGRLRAERGETRFSYVPDWYAWERAAVRRELEEGRYRLDLPVDILILADFKAMYHVGEGRLIHTAEGFTLTGCGGALEYRQSPAASYSLYADYFWYERGDMIAIGDACRQYYCFPKDQENAIVAKARLAAEELYKLKRREKDGVSV